MLRTFSLRGSLLGHSARSLQLAAGAATHDAQARRSFHHKSPEASAGGVQFDNGKGVEKWDFFGGASTSSDASGGFGAFPSALETEAQLPSARQLHDVIPSAAEAERLAMSAQTIDYSDDE